jgi:hypothetical protein
MQPLEITARFVRPVRLADALSELRTNYGRWRRNLRFLLERRFRSRAMGARLITGRCR